MPPPQGDASWEFWRALGSPKFVCAPMVRGSERAFRELVRQYRCQLAYTPMIDADELVRFANLGLPIEQVKLHGGDNIAGLDVGPDEKVVVQLAGCNPATMVAAGKYVQEKAVAICVNMGCPQSRALGCGFGVALLREPQVACTVLSEMCKELSIPVFCKIRVLESGRDATVSLALRFQNTGISLLAVHGRTPSAKFNGSVDLETARAVGQALEIPVLFNGGIRSREQALQVLQDHSPFAGVMVASALLANPRLFSLHEATELDLQHSINFAFEYLEFAVRYPPPGHLYLQTHMRHIFRAHDQTNKNGLTESKNGEPSESIKLWRCMSRPWMRTSIQFMALVALIATTNGLTPPDLTKYLENPFPSSVGALRRLGSTTGQDADLDQGTFLLFDSQDHY